MSYIVEIVASYEAGENAFELIVEKWMRIGDSVENALRLLHYREMLGATMVKVPPCVSSTRNNCAPCPLHSVCGKGEEGLHGRFIGAIQAYCIAGDLLPKVPLLRVVDQITTEVDSCMRRSVESRAGGERLATLIEGKGWNS